MRFSPNKYTWLSFREIKNWYDSKINFHEKLLYMPRSIKFSVPFVYYRQNSFWITAPTLIR
ncbi:hypothetical protein TSAR_002225 [Trichomalopsis sarcophagae]|uniref:Uncharacterized protein n=1 Tax=Trichomalopsis sarcophagae TaxID=543379 RepID=A0A232ELI7_9HYME|nr:hypothetical protein TSAR_002225 [Trichomalopsis sarcophagae]